MGFICLDRRIEGQWSVMLPIVQRVLNTTPHIALGVESAKNPKIVFGGFQTMDRYMIPDPITGKVQQGLAAIHSKERKKVVQDHDHVEHLIDTQASIIKSAQEYQHKYICSRPTGTTRHHLWTPTSRTTGSWLLGKVCVTVCRWGIAGLRSSDRAGEVH